MAILPSLHGLTAGHIEENDVTGAGKFAATRRQRFAIGTELHRIHPICEERMIPDPSQGPLQHPTR